MRADRVMRVVAAAAIVSGTGTQVPRPAAGQPAALEVDTPLDVVDPDDGVLSLREAVDLAADRPGADVIVLLPGSGDGAEVVLSGSCDPDDTNASGDLDHAPVVGDDPLTIRSPQPEEGQVRVIRNSCPGERVLDHLGSGELVLEGVEITGGDLSQAPWPDSLGDGGGVRSLGPVVLRRSALMDNHAHDSEGGGLSAEGAVTIERSRIEGNSAERGAGGIIVHDADLVAKDSVVTHNEAGGEGGGIVVLGAATLTRVEVSHNHADDFGGGLAAGLPVDVRSSTITDNSAGSGGGGAQASGTYTDTLVADNAVVGAGGYHAGGGGLGGASVTLVRSAVVGNRVEAGAEIIEGGGILADSTTLEASTVAHNAADGSRSFGGGVFGRSVDVENSTVTANVAAHTGGIHLGGAGTVPLDLRVTASTITANRSPHLADDTADANLGAVAWSGEPAPVSGSIVAGGVGPTCVEPWLLVESSVVDDESCLSPGGVHNVVAAPGSLGFEPFGLHGGTTPTLPPSLGNPAVDHVADTACTLSADQRGETRPRGERCDAGAVEVVPELPSQPRALVADAGNREVNLRWEPPRDPGATPVSAYVVERDGLEVAEVDADVHVHVDDDLVNGRTHRYRILAVNAAGRSVASDPVDATPTGPALPPHGFIDIRRGHWAVDGVDWSADRGVVDGFGGHRFRPRSAMTRAQAAQWLWLTMDTPDDRRGPYADVGPSHWAVEGIGWAGHQRLLPNTAGPRFTPRGPVLRADWLRALWRLAGEPASAPVPGVPEGAAEAAGWATANGIVNGFPDGRLRLQTPLTRAQAIQSLFRVLSEPDAWAEGITPPSTRVF